MRTLLVLSLSTITSAWSDFWIVFCSTVMRRRISVCVYFAIIFIFNVLYSVQFLSMLTSFTYHHFLAFCHSLLNIWKYKSIIIILLALRVSSMDMRIHRYTEWYKILAHIKSQHTNSTKTTIITTIIIQTRICTNKLYRRILLAHFRGQPLYFETIKTVCAQMKMFK